MSYCFNPNCPQPQNPDRHHFCQSCGWRLRLGDRYEAVYDLGTGENSRTLVGRDRATLVQAQCLIKQFTPTGNTAWDREAAAERLRKDVAHLAIASQHPQVPDLLAYFERAGYPFLIQRFLVGPHLEQHLQEKMGPLDSEAVRSFLHDVLPILHHLHHHRLIHRDIKPTNFRRPPGQPHWWLVDLGVLKPLTATRMAQPGTVVGSADYASPEQLRGEATFASDIYSLGVVCLHLLTGLQPFDLFDSGYGCWHWRSIVPDVSPALAIVIDKMVQPALRDRWPNVETVMASLGMELPTPPDLEPRSRPIAQPWPVEESVDLQTAVTQMAVLPTTDSLFILSPTGAVEVRSLTQPTACQQQLTATELNFSALAVCPHTSMVATGSRQGILQIWQQQAGKWHSRHRAKLPHGITQLAFAATHNFLMIGDNQGRLYQWDISNQCLPVSEVHHSASITSLAYSHDGQLLASGDAEGRVKLWHLPTRDCLRTLSQQRGAITALAWLAEDQVLVTAGWDAALRWRCPQTGGVLQSIQAQGFYLPVRSLVAHPTRPEIVTGSQDGQLQCWTLTAPIEQSTSRTSAIAAAAVAPGAIVAVCLQSSRSSSAPEIWSITESGKLSRYCYPH